MQPHMTLTCKHMKKQAYSHTKRDTQKIQLEKELILPKNISRSEVSFQSRCMVRRKIIIG